MKNLKEFKALIKRYESITIDDIKSCYDSFGYRNSYSKVAKKLTGYGSNNSCTLCKAVDKESLMWIPKCEQCVYGRNYGCLNGDNAETYYAIEDANSAQELLLALQNRSKHMKSFLKCKLKTNSHA